MEALAGGEPLDVLVEGCDGRRVVDDEGERFDAEVGEVGDAGGLAARGEDAQASGVEFAREGVADSAWGAAFRGC